MHAMSSKVASYRVACFIIVMAATAMAQSSFTDLGISGGSGIVIVPTTSVAPSSQLRVNMGRVDFLRSGSKGYNVISVLGGFSTHLETFISMQSEQVGSVRSNISCGIGGKLLLPFRIPAVGTLAIYAETNSSPYSAGDGILPMNINRFCLIAGKPFGIVSPVIIAGAVSQEGARGYQPMAAIGGTIPLGSQFKLGVEGAYNHFGKREKQGMLTGMVRIFSNVSLQAGGGFIHSEPVSSWLFSAGLSFTTADLDLAPKQISPAKNIVPSFEEMEKISDEEKKIGQSAPPAPPDVIGEKPDKQENKNDRNE